jgi:nucleoside-diphosphate-sugar epimerase
MKALLDRGDSVVNYDIKPPGPEYQWLIGSRLREVSFERGSIEDLSMIILAMKRQKIEKIIHTAAIVDPPTLLNHPILAYRVNLGGTLNILEAARILGLSKVVYISSNGVFTSKRYEPIDEEHPVLLPNEGPGNGPYSISKVAGEAFGLNYGDTFGIDFIALRPSAVYGFGMKYPMYIKPMIENSVRGIPTHFDHGREIPRDYTYVKDVAFAVIKAVDVPERVLKDRIFLIGTGMNLVTPGDIEKIVMSLIPQADIEIGSGLTEWNKKEIKYRGVINITRAREQLRYVPRYDIRKGTAEYIELYRKYLENKGV